MKKRTSRRAGSIRLLAHHAAAPAVAHAEGSDTIDVNQPLESSTTIYVDIMDYTVETVEWNGYGAIYIYDPDNVGTTVYDGDTYTPNQNGTFVIDIYNDQGGTKGDWDITVDGAASGFGRIWSYEWQFYTNLFTEAGAFDGSFYSLVPGGSSTDTAVIEMLFEGLSGNRYSIFANSTGVDSGNGRSQSTTGNTVSSEYPVYINPPEIATYSFTDPTISGEGCYSTTDTEC
ncbi:MAG: hypothetical protein ACI8S6_005005, partial [Myxococcota bacterium]